MNEIFRGIMLFASLQERSLEIIACEDSTVNIVDCNKGVLLVKFENY